MSDKIFKLKNTVNNQTSSSQASKIRLLVGLQEEKGQPPAIEQALWRS